MFVMSMIIHTKLPIPFLRNITKIYVFISLSRKIIDIKNRILLPSRAYFRKSFTYRSGFSIFAGDF